MELYFRAAGMSILVQYHTDAEVRAVMRRKQRKDEFVREYPDRQSWLFFKSLPVMEVLSGTTLLQQFKAGIRRAQLKMSRVMSRNRAYTRHAILGDIAHSRAIGMP
ncbi:hypothetical protein T4A_3456 [Trichinella pseudospiralis]|uniref:Uncharacterized protein n=1 Tax=Trichinella pseudospiralis TaxID=6337 RepID=A0A0V1EIL3_TRIPS|nr:hypothetical protein T4A_3456 [Trichinella pseudospiralis]